jgi:hypothetical protein
LFVNAFCPSLLLSRKKKKKKKKKRTAKTLKTKKKKKKTLTNNSKYKTLKATFTFLCWIKTLFLPKSKKHLLKSFAKQTLHFSTSSLEQKEEQSYPNGCNSEKPHSKLLW